MPRELKDVLHDWEAVIGLEIHTEITTSQTKMFCGCPVAFGGEPNSRTCPTCAGLPGALPVPNKKAIEWTVLSGLSIGCDIARWSQFSRKNYFYPDMPANYQISQFDTPFCFDGEVTVEVDEKFTWQRYDRGTADNVKAVEGDVDKGYNARIGVTRIHLEEDTGKMIHVGGSDGRITGAIASLVDFNRAGLPLMELVSEPDIRTPEEARRFVHKLRNIFLTLGVSDCSMEEGSMRVDGNISVRKRGTTEFGTKTELKNMNSLKALHDGLTYEIVRQVELIESGGKVTQETRHYDPVTKVTSTLRSKEDAQDYRYFPEPDIAPVVLTDAQIEEIASRLPELPDQRKDRLMKDLGLPNYDAGVIAGDVELSAYFDEGLASVGKGRLKDLAKPFANLVLGDLSAYLNAEGITADASKISSADCMELVGLVHEGTISGKQAKEVFELMVESGASPTTIVEERGMKQLSDAGELEGIITAIVEVHPDQANAYRGGKTGLMGFFVGQVMKETKGQANPKMVNEILGRLLS
ncbi:MAG: Asp-tRNA(Asn)/Glu-tRNA(Gln) amidotransferase subunit GatB [Coriobacteriia bacterium]|nr:Asp-tRNA(Asn)/Glu-tRNA(Gln) amidotransferase subunit GatB [Coriobacteriia bacterium]